MRKEEYSKKVISEALIALLQEKEYHKITIQEITDKAGVSRMTYYRNFANKDEIVMYYLTRITDDFVERSGISLKNMQLREYMVILFKHLMEYKTLSLILLRVGFYDYLRQIFDRYYLQLADNEEEKYQYYMLSGAVSNLYYHYLLGNRRETPEELADRLAGFVNLF